MSDPVTTPIVVNATPTADQIAAALRVAVVSIGSIAGALGFAHVFSDDQLNMLNQMAGPAAAAVAFLLGQLHTRNQAKKLTTAASYAPDSVAVVKK